VSDSGPCGSVLRPFVAARVGKLVARCAGGATREVLASDRSIRRSSGRIAPIAFIVGFPGETEAGVEELASFLPEACSTGRLFPYSGQEGRPRRVVRPEPRRRADDRTPGGGARRDPDEIAEEEASRARRSEMRS